MTRVLAFQGGPAPTDGGDLCSHQRQANADSTDSADSTSDAVIYVNHYAVFSRIRLKTLSVLSALSVFLTIGLLDSLYHPQVVLLAVIAPHLGYLQAVNRPPLVVVQPGSNRRSLEPPMASHLQCFLQV